MMPTQREYIVTMSNGFRIRTVAQSREVAIRIVCNFEGAPESAAVKCVEVDA